MMKLWPFALVAIIVIAGAFAYTYREEAHTFLIGTEKKMSIGQLLFADREIQPIQDAPSIFRDKFSEHHCENGKCSATFTISPMNIYEDDQWKRKEAARSWNYPDSGFICSVDEDPRYPIDCIDFNATTITIKPRAGILNKDIPIYFKDSNGTEKIGSRIVKEFKDIEDIIVLEYEQQGAFHLGDNSTGVVITIAAGAKDGFVGTSASTWNSAHDATIGLSSFSGNSQSYVAAKTQLFIIGPAYRIQRSYYIFNTSSIPDAATIVNVNLSIKESTALVSDADDNDAQAYVTGIGGLTLSSNASVALEDYDQIGTVNSPTVITDKIRIEDVPANDWINFTFTSNGTQFIFKQGESAFGLREGHDVEDKPIVGDGNINEFYGTAIDAGSGEAHLNVEYEETDTTPPLFSGITEAPTNGSTYDATQVYQFNITWTDSSSFDTVTITFNNTNYSTTESSVISSGSLYSFNYTGLAVATYPYIWHANDTAGNSNITGTQNYTVLPAAAGTHLTLNGTSANLTLNISEAFTVEANLTALRVFGETDMQLFLDGALRVVAGDASISITNTTNFTAVGMFNVTSFLPATENFTGNFTTYWVNVVNQTIGDIVSPLFSSLTESPADPTTYSPAQFYQFNITWTDSSSIDTVTVSFNNTNYSTTNSRIAKFGSIYSFNISDLAASVYSYTWHANDSIGNSNLTPAQTYTIGKATGSSTLLLNGTAANLTLNISENPSIGVNLTSDVLNGEVNIQILLDGVQRLLTGDASISASNVTNFTSVGMFNITNFLPASENYTANFSTYWVNVVNETPSDTTPPLYSSLTENPSDPTVYTASQLYQFNATWTDDTAIDTVIITFNNTNYSTTQSQLTVLSSVYSFNYSSLAAGTYNYVWHANDTAGNSNMTGTQTYTISRAQAGTHLTLDGTSANLTINMGNEANLTTDFISGETAMQLLIDGIALGVEGDTSISITNTTNYTRPGTFNVTGFIPQTENYTTNFTMYSLIVQDNIPPIASLVAPPNNNVSNTGNIVFFTNGTDNVGLLNATLYHNETGTWHANSTTSVSGTFNTANFTLNNMNGTFIWNILYCDNSSNCAFAPNNFTINATPSVLTIDLIPPVITNIVENPTDPVAQQNISFFFNATITDETALETVILTFDNVNYTGVNFAILNSVYTFNRTNLGVGFHNYSWHANDTVGNSATSGNIIYEVITATSDWELSIALTIVLTIIGIFYNFSLL